MTSSLSATIDLFDDFREILVALHEPKARFVVVGGHAVAFHGHPRATNGLDGLALESQ